MKSWNDKKKDRSTRQKKGRKRGKKIRVKKERKYSRKRRSPRMKISTQPITTIGLLEGR